MASSIIETITFALMLLPNDAVIEADPPSLIPDQYAPSQQARSRFFLGSAVVQDPDIVKEVLCPDGRRHWVDKTIDNNDVCTSEQEPEEDAVNLEDSSESIWHHIARLGFQNITSPSTDDTADSLHKGPSDVWADHVSVRSRMITSGTMATRSYDYQTFQPGPSSKHRSKEEDSHSGNLFRMRGTGTRFSADFIAEPTENLAEQSKAKPTK
tara:strand:- start:8 stop:640 length:633 start_codon:yes stop_codon:yes gene_type:complete